jgi:hypothetical protein
LVSSKFYGFDVDDFTDYLNLGYVVLQFVDLVIPRSVNVSVREKINQIYVLINPQFLTQQFAPIGTNAFEVFDGSE